MQMQGVILYKVHEMRSYILCEKDKKDGKGINI